MVTKDLEENSLMELILALNKGLTTYGDVNKNFVPIKLSFSQCAYLTAITAIEELQAYICDLDRDICSEPLCLDLDEFGSLDYWLEKLAKLRSDMTELEELPILQHDLVWGYLGFFPKSTTEFYQGVEQKVMEVAGLINQVQQKMAEKPLSFYGKFYHDLMEQYDEEQAVKDYTNRKKELGVVTHDKLISLQAQFIAEFVNNGILSVAFDPSDEEGGKVDVEQFKKLLPRSYNSMDWLKDDFDNWFVIFNRTAKWEGDIVTPDYDCAGLFIFQHWEELKEGKVNSIFYLDKMLELVNEDIMQYQPTETEESKNIPVKLPEVLATPEAMILWKKVQDAGYVDERYQPILSRPEAALLAFEMAKILDIDDQWKAFETLWNRRNMSRDYYTGMSQKKSGDFLGDLRKILG